jgi:hypothetical protein
MPFLPSREWKIETIYNLARLHTRTIQDLCPIFLQNLKDIHNKIHSNGFNLYQGFQAMQLTGINGKDPAKPLLESIHNTSDPAIKVALVPKDNVENTKIQFAALHSILLENVPVDFHHNVFVGSLQAGPMTQQVESFLASKSAAYAQGLL